jgi:hypothetical protein
MPSQGSDRVLFNLSPQQSKWLVLMLSIVIDVIGLATYLFPGLGEAFDFGWAPISAALLQYLYGNWLVTIGNFIEELSPGMDFIPTALIAWYLTYGKTRTSPE